MNAYSLSLPQRQAVIESIRKRVVEDENLKNVPDDLLLATLHALTGRAADLIRHVTATARRLTD